MTGGALRGDGRGWLVLTLGLGWFVTLGTRFVVPTVPPRIQADFALSNTAAGVAVTVIWLAYGATQLPAGALIDTLGERRLLAGSLLVGGGGLLAFAGSPTFAVLLLAAAAYGIGTGLYGPARATVLSRTFPDNDGAAFSVVLGAGSVGAAAMPLAAGVLVGWIGWRVAVGVFVPLFLVIAAGLWWAVPADGATRGTGAPLDARLRGVRAAVTRRAVVLPGLAVLFMLFAFQGLTAFLPTYLVTERGLSQATASAVFAGMFVSGAVFQVVTGGLADRFGHQRVLAVVAVASVPPLLLLPVARGLPVIVGLTVLFGIRFVVPPVANAYIVRVLPEDVRGTAWGLVRSVFFVVGATGSTVVGAFADRGLFDEAFLVLAAVTLLGAVCFALLPPRESVVAGTAG